MAQLPALDALAEHLEDDPHGATLHARAVIVTDGIDLLAAKREKLMRDGASAVRKLQETGENAPLTRDESVGLEAVVHAVGRPAMLVFDSQFGEAPFGWQILDDNRASIERKLPSVGRVEIHAGGEPPRAWGTGFLVADGVVMTNRHVVNGLGNIKDYIFTLGKPHLDYLAEDGNPTTARFRIASAKVHDDVDLALMHVEPIDGSPDPPPPLRIAGTPPENEINLYAIGYPVTPGDTPPEVLEAIFGNTFGVKRLQPGKLMTIRSASKELLHDASTLGGSSGSPIIDVDRDLVVGLHFSGIYKNQNYAVTLWELTNDPLLKEYGLKFY
jgi:S1-C subfamily serine protease